MEACHARLRSLQPSPLVLSCAQARMAWGLREMGAGGKGTWPQHSQGNDDMGLPALGDCTICIHAPPAPPHGFLLLI